MFDFMLSPSIDKKATNKASFKGLLGKRGESVNLTKKDLHCEDSCDYSPAPNWLVCKTPSISEKNSLLHPQ
jgi:hypothetical protein